MTTGAELQSLVETAKARYNTMSSAEKDAHDEAQRENFVRGQLGMGSDRDEAEYRAAMRKSSK